MYENTNTLKHKSQNTLSESDTAKFIRTPFEWKKKISGKPKCIECMVVLYVLNVL